MLKIVLNINGKEKIYIQNFISVRMLREALILGKEMLSGQPIYEDEIDKMIDFTIRLYGNKFTVDDLYDGFEGNKLVSKVMDDINIVLGRVDEKVSDEPEKAVEEEIEEKN